MAEDNPLQRAHQLSREAGRLTGANAPVGTLSRALATYREATTLFERAGASADDDNNRQTLRMLTMQHQKLARDVERRIAHLTAAPLPPSPTSPRSPTMASSPTSPRSSSFPFASGSGNAGPSSSGTAPDASRVGGAASPPPFGRRASGIAAGLTAGRGMLANPGLVHATSPRSVPPFSLRPVQDTTGTGVGTSQPQPPHPFMPGSPLYSSSSSSEPPEESYLLPGAVPDTADPFSRFWGMLENMLEDISFPKALATAQLDATPKPAEEGERSHRPRKQSQKSTAKEREPSPSESFYVVPRDRERKPLPDPPARTISPPSVKTNEELMLENESLRESLDKLAEHAHQVELRNKTLVKQAEERERQVHSHLSALRREAQKTQDVVRSQMLSSSMAVSQAGHPPPSQSGAQAALRKRVGELEEENRGLRQDNEKLHQDNNKLRGQLDKFKDKWDKLKAKKEAKAAAKARASRSPEPGPLGL